MRERVILFLGAPGSGKGTQSSLLARHLGIPGISTGEMLRAEARRNTAAGRKLRRVLAAGTLVDDDTVCAAVEAVLRRELPRRGMILDGFPRTVAQAQCLENILSAMAALPPLVLHLHVPRERLLDRLTSRRHCGTCGTIFNLRSQPSRLGTRCEKDGGILIQRDDDTKSVIERRLADFDVRCSPLVGYYSGADYHRIDGDADPDAVSAGLRSIVERAAAQAVA